MPRTKKYKIGGSQYTQEYVNNPDNYVLLPGKRKRYLLKNTVSRENTTFNNDDLELDPIVFKKISKKDAYFIAPYVYNIKSLFEGIFAHNMVNNPMTREPLNIEEISREYELRYSKKTLQPLPKRQIKLLQSAKQNLQPSSIRTRLQTSPLRPLPQSRRTLQPSSIRTRLQTSPLRPLPQSRRTLQPSPSRTRLQTSPLRPLPQSRRKVHI